MKFTWLAAAVALAGWLIARRHKQQRWSRSPSWSRSPPPLLIGFGVIQLPNFEKVLEDAGRRSGSGPTCSSALLAFLETGAFLGFIAPGETAVIVGGLVAGQGQISLFVLIAIVWACAVLGDLTSFTLGRRSGAAGCCARRAAEDHRGAAGQVEGFFERRGGVTIIVGRFLGFVRPLRPFIAGASRMPLRRFLPYDVLAAGAWTTTFCDARLRLLALDRPADDLRLPRPVRARDARRGDRGDRRARPAAPQPGGAREGARVARRARRPAGLAVRRAGRPAGLADHRAPAAAVADFTARFTQRSPPASSGSSSRRCSRCSPSARSRSSARRHRARRRASRGSTAGRRPRRPAPMDQLVDIAKVVTYLGSLAVIAPSRRRRRSWPLVRAALDRRRRARRRLAAVSSPCTSPRPRTTARGRRTGSSRRELGVSRPATRPTRSRSSRARRSSCAPASAGRPGSPPSRWRGHRRGRRRDPRLPARALPHGRDRRGRARRSRSGRSSACSRLFAGRVRHNGGPVTDDQKTT